MTTTSEADRERHQALLVLEDGAAFPGWSFGAEGEAFGEVVFNTSMTGYQEMLTDPSYHGQIVVMTYPEVGIYGVNGEDGESCRIQAAGFAVYHAVSVPSSHRADESMPEFLRRSAIPGIEGIDTRALTRRIRSCGAMRGGLSTLDLDPDSLIARVREQPMLAERDLAGAVTCESSPLPSEPARNVLRVVLVDAGAKRSIAAQLADYADRPLEVFPVPYNARIEDVLRLDPQGVLVSNGPGDPSVLPGLVALIRELLDRRIPVGGICLGHQLLGLAAGAHTYKMKFGHRGSNHPVKELKTGRILITAQNHGFAIDPVSLGLEPSPRDAVPGESSTSEPRFGESPGGYGQVEITHVSLNDGSVEGLRLTDRPAVSVQFHPEASPGPHDASGFFARFLSILEKHHAETI